MMKQAEAAPAPQSRTQHKGSFKTAKERIEAWPDVSRLEMSWYRSKPGELRPDAVERKADRFGGDLPLEKDRSHIHTHPEIFGDSVSALLAAPSIFDLKFVAMHVAFYANVRAWHITSINNEGEVIGYTSFEPTQKLSDLAETIRKYARAMDPIIEGAMNNAVREARTPASDDAQDYMAALSVFLRMRFTPMPGYVFDKDSGCFVKS